MSFLQRSDFRRYWWLILILILVLIYWVYLLIGQLHPPFPCTPNGTCPCDTSSNFLDSTGICILPSNTIVAGCNPVQPTDPSNPNNGGIICHKVCLPFPPCLVPILHECVFNSPFSSPLPNATTLFFNGTYFEVTGSAMRPASCVNPEVGCFNYSSAISCQDL